MSCMFRELQEENPRSHQPSQPYGSSQPYPYNTEQPFSSNSSRLAPIYEENLTNRNHRMVEERLNHTRHQPPLLDIPNGCPQFQNQIINSSFQSDSTHILKVPSPESFDNIFLTPSPSPALREDENVLDVLCVLQPRVLDLRKPGVRGRQPPPVQSKGGFRYTIYILKSSVILPLVYPRTITCPL